jgi:GntR family transcriptional regulator
MPKADEEALDHRPLHARVAADLRDGIMTGDLAPGTALPSTQRLKERFGVSNATVQKALGLLKDEGLVAGRAGAAVTVRPHRQETVSPAATAATPAPGGTFPWLADAARRGRRGAVRLLDVGETVPPADVSAALDLATGATAVRRRQLLTHDGDPVELVASYYPADLARGTALAEPRRIRGGSPALLTALGHPPRHTVDRVSARVPTQEQYEALHLTGDLPVLRTFRIVHDHTGHPVEVVVMAKAGHLYELEYAYEHEPAAD